MPQDAFVLRIQRELCHPKCAGKVSGLLRNRSPRPLVFRSLFVLLQLASITGINPVNLVKRTMEAHQRTKVVCSKSDNADVHVFIKNSALMSLSGFVNNASLQKSIASSLSLR